jgi:hypothetical protein
MIGEFATPDGPLSPVMRVVRWTPAGARLPPAFRDVRAAHRAVDWLLDSSLISQDAAARFRMKHPEPAAP